MAADLGKKIERRRRPPRGAPEVQGISAVAADAGGRGGELGQLRRSPRGAPELWVTSTAGAEGTGADGRADRRRRELMKGPTGLGSQGKTTWRLLEAQSTPTRDVVATRGDGMSWWRHRQPPAVPMRSMKVSDEAGD